MALVGLVGLWSHGRRVRWIWGAIPLTQHLSTIAAVFWLAPLYGIADPIPESPAEFWGVAVGTWLAIVAFVLAVVGLGLDYLSSSASVPNTAMATAAPLNHVNKRL